MAEESIRRRLAAILAADVVGYSRLMDADEPGTLLRLKAVRRELFEPTIKRYRGRVFKTTGDGALVEFKSAVDAVNSAVAIQRGLAERNDGEPEGRCIALRIGVSLGDVMVEGSDLYGNAVNVAARMEGLAEPGGVCISGNVHEHVQRAAGIAFDDLGEQPVKNIERPVRCYRVRLDQPGEDVQPTATAARAVRPGIAVLPFANMSGDPEQEYFADGMVEEIITGLSRIRWLEVIARNSSFAYKGRSPDIRKVGRELGVRYVLEGSVRRAGDRVRITGQLIEADTGAHLWADRFDGKLEDVFDLQDEITAAVVGAIEPNLRKAEIERARRKRPDSLDAYDLYLRALAQFCGYTTEGRRAALVLLEQALARDPDYAEAHGLAAACHDMLCRDGDTTSRAPGIEHARAVQVLHTEDAATLAFAATACQFLGLDAEAALGLMERALAVNPSSVPALIVCANVYGALGVSEKAIDLAERALRLSPFDPMRAVAFTSIAVGCQTLGNNDAALAASRRALQFGPEFVGAHVRTISALVRLGRLDEARAAAGRFLEIRPNYRVSRDFQAAFADRDAVMADLRAAGVPE